MSLIPGNTTWQRTNVFAATGFGIGLIAPFAPGTFGTLPGVALAYVLSTRSITTQVITALVLTLLAIPICHVAETVLQKKDDGRICADEWMLFPLCVIGIPLHQTLLLLPVFFVVARICDIIKPPPANVLQKINGGVGIVIDDFVASFYALALNHLIYRCWLIY